MKELYPGDQGIWVNNTPDEINISDAMKKNITLCL